MARSPRRLLCYCLTAVVPAIGMLTAATVSARASAITAPAAAAQAKALAVAAIQQLQVGRHPLSQKTGATNETSGNWAGYADTGTSFSKVAASWTEPSAACTSGAEQLAAFWVGIDGYAGASVEQDGTLIECFAGKAYQYTWWEMFPANAMQVVGSTVAAGDAITAAVARSGTSYTLKVTDSTHPANSFSKAEGCSSCAGTSAEWIAEAPSNGSSDYPLTDFRSWTVASAKVTRGAAAGSISSSAADEVTMVSSAKKVKAQPGSLNGGGSGFTVTWERAS